jgi:mRNA interferase MazF
MTAYSRGDVVLVGFVFSDASGTKLRPALVVSATDYNRRRQEVLLAAITSNVDRLLFGDHPISDWKAAGLLFPSVVTGIIRTMKRSMIDRRLGSMPKADLKAVDQQLRRCLGV